MEAAPMSTETRPPSNEEAAVLARKQISDIRECRVLTAVHYCYGHALGWISAMYRVGVLDWPTREALYKEATQAMDEWREPPSM